MTHCPKFLEKDVATNLLWSMIPETKAFCPRGLGIIPYKLPSSVELAEATIKELQDYDVVMWEKHGVFAVDCDAMQAFDQIDVLNKSAVKTFLHQQDFTGKTVVPFMTNGGWPGHVIKDMKVACKGANVVCDMQIQFDSTGGSNLETPQEQINEWIQSVKNLL